MGTVGLTNAELSAWRPILRARVGSGLLGVSLPGTDDRDEMGVCVEPPTHVLGLGSFEQHVERTQPEGVRSGPGDLDVVVYGLKKFLRLALSGNPTILLLLFVPEEMLLVAEPLGLELQRLAPALVSKRAGAAFLGYMEQQRQRLTGERGQKRVNRPELEAAHGFDTKYAYHILRLGMQGVELLQTGRLTLPLPAAEREYLLAVRRGELDLNDVLTRAGLLEQELKDELGLSPLPEEPDRERADRWLQRAYLSAWGMVLA